MANKIDVEARLECTFESSFSGFACSPLVHPCPLAANSKYSVNCGDSRAAWRPERRTKGCRLERRGGLTRINANWGAATGSSSIFVVANGTRPCALPCCTPPCFRCALVGETCMHRTRRLTLFFLFKSHRDYSNLVPRVESFGSPRNEEPLSLFPRPSTREFSSRYGEINSASPLIVPYRPQGIQRLAIHR